MPKEIAALEQKSQEENFWNDQKEAKQLFAKLKGLRSVWEPVRDLAGDVAAFMELMEGTQPFDTPGRVMLSLPAGRQVARAPQMRDEGVSRDLLIPSSLDRRAS